MTDYGKVLYSHVLLWLTLLVDSVCMLAFLAYLALATYQNGDMSALAMAGGLIFVWLLSFKVLVKVSELPYAVFYLAFTLPLGSVWALHSLATKFGHALLNLGGLGAFVSVYWVYVAFALFIALSTVSRLEDATLD